MKRMWSKKAILSLIGGGGLTPESLKAILIGSDYVSVDYADRDHTKLVVEIDETNIAQLLKDNIKDSDTIKSTISGNKLFIETNNYVGVKALKDGDIYPTTEFDYTLSIPTITLSDGTSAPKLDQVQESSPYMLFDFITDIISHNATQITLVDEEGNYSTVLGYDPINLKLFVSTGNHILQYELGLETPKIIDARNEIIINGTIDFTTPTSPIISLSRITGSQLYAGLVSGKDNFGIYPKVHLKLSSLTESFGGEWDFEMTGSRTRNDTIELMGFNMQISGIPSTIRNNTIAIQMSVEDREEISISCKAWTDANP